MNLIRKGLSEFLGTYLLVFCGTGAMTINEVLPGSVTHVGICITFGLIVTAVIYALGNISGAHINPAVSVVEWVNKKLSLPEFLIYLFTQFAGAAAASFSLLYLFPESQFLGASLPAGSVSQAFILEVILTFILLFVILMVTTREEEGVRHLAGIVIGMVVMLEALFAGPVTGASMNPARSFGPAIVSGHTEHLWLYFAAPVSGALLAFGVFKILSSAKSKTT